MIYKNRCKENPFDFSHFIYKYNYNSVKLTFLILNDILFHKRNSVNTLSDLYINKLITNQIIDRYIELKRSIYYKKVLGSDLILKLRVYFNQCYRILTAY